MTNLRSIENPLALPDSISPSPVDRPLTSSEKIRHTEQVPGTTDNDGDSWRKEHVAQNTARQAEILDNATAVAEQRAATRDLHASDYPGTWETADDAKIVVTTAVPPQLRAVVPSAGSWASATASVTQAIPSNLRDTLVFVQLPVGASKSDYRVLRQNTGPNDASATGTIESSRWGGLDTSITSDYPDGLYEQVFQGGLGTHWTQIVWTVQKHSDEVHETEYRGIFDGTFSDEAQEAILAETLQIFDTFPDASDYSVGKNIIVRGQSYRLTESDSDELEIKPESVTFEGPNWPLEWVGFSLPGFGHVDHIPAAGEPAHNPNDQGAPVLLGAGIEANGEGASELLEDQRHFTVAISEAAYRTGFGQGNIVAGEAPLWVRTIGQIQGAARSVDQQLYYYVQSTVGGTNYLFFMETYEGAACPISEVASPQSALCPVLWIMQDAITRDTAVTLKMWAGTSGTNTQGSPFVPDTSKPVTGFDDTGWTLTHDRQVVINERAARAIGPLTERVEELEQDSAGQSNARLQTLEDKTSHIDFDDTTTWVAADNTAVGGKHPYGKWAWVFRGSQVASYQGHDYDGVDDFYTAAGAGPSGAGYGLLWVLPNNINWSRVRLVVRRADGTVKSTINAQGLRNAPSTIAVTNLPASPPDVTVRWSSHDDTHPFATTNFETGDTVALEVLPAAHTPVWNGELSDEVTDLLTETQAYLDSLDEIRFEANPDSLVISSVPSEFDAGSGVTTDATADIAAEHPLVESLVRSIRHGYDRPLRVVGNLKFYFQRAQPQTTSGAILQMRVSLRVRGKDLSVDLLSEANTIQDFTDAQTAYGNFMYPPLNSPSKEFDLDELVDLSDWTTLEDDDEIQFHLEGGGVNAQARIRLDFDDVTLSFDHANIRGVPNLPADNERDGKALKFAGHELGWHPTLNVSTILANSVGASIGNNLNNLRWEAHPNALGTGTVGTASSGTILTIDGRVVAKSNTFGIIVRIERGTPTRIASEVFIPWSQFRTGSGTYVTNAVGAIRQGIFAGFWDDSRANSVMFAECTMHESNGQLQLKVDGAYGDPSSRMTVHLAR